MKADPCASPPCSGPASGAALSLAQGRLRPPGPSVDEKNREKCSWYWFFLFPDRQKCDI